MPYEGVDHSAWGEVADEDRECKKCDRFGTCSFTHPKLRLNVSAFGLVKGEAQMLQELQNGPIACSLFAHADSFENYAGGIIVDPRKYNTTTHVVEILGCESEEDGLSSWFLALLEAFNTHDVNKFPFRDCAHRTFQTERREVKTFG